MAANGEYTATMSCTKQHWYWWKPQRGGTGTFCPLPKIVFPSALRSLSASPTNFLTTHLTQSRYKRYKRI